MLSIPHLIVIFVVALIVFGPEKLPELARNIGKVMAEFKRATGDLRSTFEGHMRDLEREADQRHAGASSPAPTSAPGAAEVIAAPKIIPANPPHAAAAGEPSAAGSPADESRDESPTGSNPESASHGGARPA